MDRPPGSELGPPPVAARRIRCFAGSSICAHDVAKPVLVIAAQLLDGISGTVLGVLQPLIIADLIGRTGRFNLAQGFVGTASGLGASLSTTVSGLIAGTFGLTAGFAALTAIAVVALLVVWGLMPETKTKA
jgi:sugar phosphate permease